jgi:hypothetical protein
LSRDSSLCKLIFLKFLSILDSNFQGRFFKPQPSQIWDLITALARYPDYEFIEWLHQLFTDSITLALEGFSSATIGPEIIVALTSLCVSIPEFWHDLVDRGFQTWLNENVICDLRHPALMPTLDLLLLVARHLPNSPICFSLADFLPLFQIGCPALKPAGELASYLIANAPGVRTSYLDEAAIAQINIVLNEGVWDEKMCAAEMFLRLMDGPSPDTDFPPDWEPLRTEIWEIIVSVVPELEVEAEIE